MRGERHDRDGLPAVLALPTAQLADHRVAIHLRHLDVEEDHVEWRGLKALQGLPAGLSEDRRDGLTAEQCLDDEAILSYVVDDQHSGYALRREHGYCRHRKAR